MRIGLSEEFLRIYEDLNDAIYDLEAKDRIMVFVQTMTYEDSVAYLDICSSARFYREIMNNQIRFVEDLRSLADGTDEGGIVERSCFINYMVKPMNFSSWSPQNVKATYDHFTSPNEDRLIFLLKILRGLRASIAVAAPTRDLPYHLLETLRFRLREFDQRGLYSEACSAVAWASPEESQFVAASETWWLVTHFNKALELTCQGLHLRITITTQRFLAMSLTHTHQGERHDPRWPSLFLPSCFLQSFQLL
jgi:hypothetical protein